MALSPETIAVLKRTCAIGISSALLGSAFPRVAHADAVQTARAQALFDDGVKLMKDGKYADACPKLFESNRLDSGLGTLLHLADCYEKAGKVASAWATFADSADLAKRANDQREKTARNHMNALAPKVPHLIVQVNGVVPGEEVRIDGEVIGQPSWSTSIPYDPGPHSIEASAAGRQSFKKSVELAPGQSATVTIDPLAPSAAQSPTASPDAASATATTGNPPPQAAESSGSLRKPIGFAVAGVGVVVLGLSAYFHFHANGQQKDAANLCNPYCGSDAESLESTAKSTATISTVMFATGLVALGAGVALVVTAPSSTATGLRVSPMIGKTEGGFLMGGAW